MKNSILLIISLFFSHHFFAQTDINISPQKINSASKKSIDDDLQVELRSPFRLDSAYHYLLPDEQLNIREYYTYDTDELTTFRTRVALNLITNEWVNVFYNEIIKDGNGNISTFNHSPWNATTGTFELSTQTTYDYDMNGNQTNSLLKEWNSTQMALVNSVQIIDSFDMDNKKIETHKLGWNAISNEWVEQTKTTYTYDIAGNLSGQLVENWIFQLGFYTKFLRHIYNHELDNQIIDTIQLWDNTFSTWNNYSIDQDFYLGSGKISSRYDLTWDENLTPANWVFEDFIGYTYDGNGNLAEEFHQDFSASSGVWDDKLKWVYFYSDLDPSPVNLVEENVLDCFSQNPIRSGDKISCQGEDGFGKYDLRVFDFFGKLVFENTFAGNVEFSLPRNLESGMYFLNVMQEGKVVYLGKLVLVD